MAKKESVLERDTSGYDGPSMWDDDGDGNDAKDMPQTAFQYDSDSSGDGTGPMARRLQKQRMQKLQQKMRENRRSGGGGNQMPNPPQQLPFPPPKRADGQPVYLYQCQQPKVKRDDDDDQDKSETEASNIVPVGIQDDPPFVAPFLSHWSDDTPREQRKAEQRAWMIFKFPTRLPRFDPRSTLSGMNIKNESSGENNNQSNNSDDEGQQNIDMMDLEDDENNNAADANPTAVPGGVSAATGYDDTLKDAAPGRYGKIVVHRSGKTYLIIGSNDGKYPQVRMQLTEGLQCGFLQQAVSIDPDEGTYIPLGDVKKSLNVMPDVESAFS